MKTPHSYTDPTIRQVKALCSVLSEALGFPDKQLTQFWIDNPRILAGALQTLCYRPVMVPLTRTHRITDCVFENLHNAGLVDYTPHREEVELVIVGCYNLVDAKFALEYANLGVLVIAKVIEEDKSRLDHKNIFLYTEDQHSVTAIEAFARDVLFKLRDRFWCGPAK